MKYIVMSACTLFLFLGCSGGSGDSLSGGKLYHKNCASCHGKKAQEAAFGKAQVLAGWSKENLKEALMGYKDGTYGGSMKGLMRAEVKPFSEAELGDIAEYISNINK
jgi:cytochrome c553